MSSSSSSSSTTNQTSSTMNATSSTSGPTDPPPPPPPTSSSASPPPAPTTPTPTPTPTKSNPPPPTPSSPSSSSSKPDPSSPSSPSSPASPSEGSTSPNQNPNSPDPPSSSSNDTSGASPPSSSGSTDNPFTPGSSSSSPAGGAGSVTPVTPSLLPPGVATSSFPHGGVAPVSISTRIITTTQPGGHVVTLTTTLTNPTLSTTTPGQHSSVNTRAIAAASTIGGLAVLSIVGWLVFAYRRKRRRDHMERDSATAAMMAAGILHPPFADTPNQTPMVERGLRQQYFEDGTPINSAIEPPRGFGSYPTAAYAAVGQHSSSNGTGTSSISKRESNGAAPRSPSAMYSTVPPGYEHESNSRPHSPPVSVGTTTYPPPAAAFNVRRSMRSASSSDDSHYSQSQGHASLFVPQQQQQQQQPPFPPAFHLLPPPKNGTLPPTSYQPYTTHPHNYPSGLSPAGSSLPGSGSGSGSSHEALEAASQGKGVNQPLLPNVDTGTPPDENELPEMNRHLLGTPAGIPVSSSEISLGYGNSEGYHSALLSRPRLEVRNRTGSFRTGSESEISKHDVSEK